MPFRAYTLVPAIPLLVGLSLVVGGVSTWLVPVLIFGLIPLLELRLRGATTNPTPAEEDARRRDWRFDAVLYGLVPVQLAVVLLFVWRAPTLDPLALAGAVVGVGTCCGAVGINLGHELGHRRGRAAQWTAKLFLGTSLYAHFFVEHNRGHHSRVATDADPATAREGEWLYPRVLRSVIGGARSAWRLEGERLGRQGRSAISWGNEVLVGWVLQAAAVGGVGAIFGPVGMAAWLAAAAFGVFLLETVNYIEHYGLLRERRGEGWAPVTPAHSWNSERPLSRALLFDLTRHADHHAHPTRPYPLLRHMPEAPELPTGYAGMVLLALVPPLYTAVMARCLAAERARTAVA